MLRIVRVVPLVLVALGAAAFAQPTSKPQTRSQAVDTRPAPFDERVALPMDLTSACQRAGAANQRVLVIWGRNDSERITKLVAAVNLPDNLKLLALDYQVLWVNIAQGPNAARNLELAVALGVEISKDAEHAAMSIHGPDGLPVARTGVDSFGDTERPSNYSPLRFQDFISAHKPRQPAAQQLIDDALASAKARNKAVLVRFYELGDEWADKFEALLAQPEILKLVSAHAIPVRAHVQRNPGTMDLLARFMPKAESYPLYVLLDADGKAVAMSQPEGEANIGYPTDDQEIARFVELLSAGPSKLSPAEASGLTALLQAQRRGPSPLPPVPLSRPSPPIPVPADSKP